MGNPGRAYLRPPAPHPATYHPKEDHMATKFCRYIRTNGERCGSPALTSKPFCYYHVERREVELEGRG